MLMVIIKIVVMLASVTQRTEEPKSSDCEGRRCAAKPENSQIRHSYAPVFVFITVVCRFRSIREEPLATA